MAREYCDYIGEDAESIHQSSVYDIPDAELLRRAVKNARSNKFRKGQNHWRWIAVMDLFGLGSTYSWQLLRRFGLHGDEEVKR
jgi:hypothetical protein